MERRRSMLSTVAFGRFSLLVPLLNRPKAIASAEQELRPHLEMSNRPEPSSWRARHDALGYDVRVKTDLRSEQNRFRRTRNLSGFKRRLACC